MTKKLLAVVVCLVLGGAAWLAGGNRGADAWLEVAPGVLRTASFPAGYALVSDSAALLIDAPRNSRGLAAHGISKVESVLLTHYHRGSCAAVGQLLKDGIKVRAPKAAAEWLTADGVRKYWQESMPLRSSRTAYLVVPEGFSGIDCSLDDGQEIAWRGWTIRAVSTPGHARAHLSFAVRKANSKDTLLFCGGAMASAGKIWAPYTTDWDHWTDAGLVPAAKSLHTLAEFKPAMVLPAHGPVITKNATAALLETARALEEVAFLKSFERFTKQRLGNAPTYRFLAKEQATSNGSLPWSQISEHLFVTGNTFVLTSKDKACLMFDPWDKRSADQFLKLQREKALGPLEVVMFSHAHYDHYDGIYHLPERGKFEVWMLDQAAVPVADPGLLRAPFIDARPVKIDRLPRDGDTLTWREYRFRFHHFPGQSEFTMGVETAIDGKRCFFTADNFFHQDMFSGSGGWMGLNRSFPLPYAQSAKKVLDAAPDWVLAEHGGPFEFNAEDFRRRVAWGKASAAAADAVCLSGNHRHDWDPHRVRIEPILQTAKAGQTIKAALVVTNNLLQAEIVDVALEGRGWFTDQSFRLDVPAGKTVRREFEVKLNTVLPTSRHVFTIELREGRIADGADGFFVVDVGR